jgi:hypothetical protein
MNWIDMIGFTATAAAGMECVVGRLAQLDRRHHRPVVIVIYACMACLCILAGSLTWQGKGVYALDILSLAVAGHLVLTWEDWRHGPPLAAERGGDWPRDALPSRVEGGDRQS